MSDKLKNPITLPEGRLQPRVQAQVPIRIVVPGSGRVVDADLSNLSWGGAQFHCHEEPGQAGETLEVELPYHLHEPIRIESEILRVEAAGEGRYMVAVRFSSISPAEESHLEHVLEMLLSGSGGGRRVHPRLVQRLEIYFDDPSDVRATLEDISHGGLSVTVPYAFALNQSVELTVYARRWIGELRLRARVVHQETSEGERPQLYRIGLRFEHPTPDLRELVGRLLKRLISREEMRARRHKQE